MACSYGVLGDSGSTVNLRCNLHASKVLNERAIYFLATSNCLHREGFYIDDETYFLMPFVDSSSPLIVG